MNKKSLLKPQHIVDLATIQHLSPSQIAEIAGISRQQIWKTLRDNGVNTSKGPGGLTRVRYSCDFCGNLAEMNRARWRKSKEHFCSSDCYYASRENPGYHPWRQGQRLARAIVNQYIRLDPDNVVHHKDDDNHNNDRANLAVYASQSDHLKHHHNKGSVIPIWDGATVV